MILIVALTGAAPAANGPPGLVAAYSFDEGSGTTLSDASSNGHNGTISGASWTAGHDGGALSFDGTSSSVDLGALGTFYQSGFTLEAWVKKQSSKKDVAVLGSWNGGGPMLWVDHINGDNQLVMNSGMSNYLDSGQTPAIGQWQYLTATFDGSTARYYIDGTQVASRSVGYPIGSSNVWRIGAYASPATGFFDGLIDDVRVYDRALSAAEVQTDMNLPVGAAGPSLDAPGGATVTNRTKTTLSLQWTASSGASGYRVYRDGSQVDTTSATSDTFSGLSCGTSYQLGVEAFDSAGNTSPRSTLTASTALCDAPTGLVATYSFDDGAGTVLSDSSGNGHNGTISGASWTAGHDGGALSFDGTSSSVDLGALGTFYQSGFTLEAWVKKQSSKKDVAVLGSWNGGGPMLWVDHINGDNQLVMNSGMSNYLDSGQTPAIGQWQYLTATFDGSTARYYIDGTQVASRSVGYPIGSSNVWRIGAYASPATGFFDGLIDDVRVYDRALSAAEVQTDMTLPVAPSGGDTTPPTAPTNLTPTATTSSVSLTWGAAIDNRGVDHYDVYRGTSSGFTPTPANRIGTASGTSFTDSNLAPGTYYYKVAAEDAGGNVGPTSNEASGLVDASPPNAPSALTATGGIGRVDLSWQSSSDDVGIARYDVHRGTSSGFTPTTANRIAQPTGTSYADTGLTAGTYYYKVLAEDVAGNIGPSSNEAQATVTSNAAPPTISISSPSPGAVSGVQAVTASATAGQGVAGVQFKLDGANLGVEDTSSPFTVSWDTRAELNGSHTLTAVVRDTAGTTATAAAVAVTVSNAGVSTAGLQVAYNLDDGPIGTAALDTSGNYRTGTLVNGTWTSAGLYGGAAALNGTSSEVDPPALGTFYKTGFTLEAWAYKLTSKTDVGLVGTLGRSQSGGPMIWVDTRPATTG